VTPTAPELLIGNFLCLIDPPPPESMGEFMVGRVAVTGLIALLCAQEAERGVEARLWENSAIRAVLSRAAADHGAGFREAARGHDQDFNIPALDRANAALRTALTELHVAAESAGDTKLCHDIIRLYVRMADARRLDLPPLPAT
jgi:hypothetical protein